MNFTTTSLCCFLLVLLLVPGSSIYAQPFAGGDGTLGNPYQVATAIQLDSVRNYASAHFLQTANIDLNITPYNTGEGWVPIPSFSGFYNGGGFTISGLFINRGSTDNVGLFGTVSGTFTSEISTIEKLALSAPVVTGNNQVGALVGTLTSGELSDVAIKGGTVTANGSNGGGIVGSSSERVQDSYASTRVIGNGGGSYGGLVGTLLGSARLTRSYAAGMVTGTGAGGLVGSLAVNARSFETYYNTDSTSTSPGEGVGLTTAQMYQQSSFDSEFNFTYIWVMLNEGSAFPELQVLADPSPLFAGGSGTQADPLLVATAEHLNNVRRFPSWYFLQTADIDLNMAPYNTGEGWTPIPLFVGTFDGGGYTISNLYISPTTTQNQVGFFDQLGTSNAFGGSNALSTLRDVTLLNPSVTNGTNAGALAGIAAYTDLTNVRIIGGSVTGEGAAGGLIGFINRLSFSIQINNCLSTGMAITTNSTTNNTSSGGLFGSFVGSITNSYVANTVQGGATSGGLAGDGFGNFINSYSASVVTSSGTVGGLLGTQGGSFLNISNSFYNSDSTSAVTSFGTGLTTAQMRQRASFTSWDFSGTWFIDEGVSFPGLLENKGSFLNITGGEGWRMFTSPLASKSIGTLLGPLWTQGFTGADAPNETANVYLWNESTRSWSAPTDTSVAPAAGTGFLMYVYSDDNLDGNAEGFPKRLSPSGTALTGQQSLNLSYTNTGSSADDGWNLVGNPYPSTINWNASQGWTRNNMDQTFYVWSDAESNGNGAYVTWNTLGIGTKGDGLIAPWQGFWVKANAASPQVVFTDTVRNAGGALLKQAKPVIPKIDLELEGGALSSKTIVLFHELAERGKDPLDAYKLQSLSPDYLLLGTTLDGLETMDIQALPYPQEPVEVSLVIEGSDLNGDFNLNWARTDIPEDWEISLTDTQTGQTYQVESDGSISFSMSTPAKASKQGDSGTLPKAPIQVVKAKTAASSRFVLRIQSGSAVSNDLDLSLPTTVALEQNYPNPFNPGTTINYQINVQSRVRLEVFDLLGRKVATLVNNELQQAGQYQVRFDASSLSSGVYLYRLETGSKVLLKKMTVIK